MKRQLRRHGGEYAQVTEREVTEPGLQAGSPPHMPLTWGGTLVLSVRSTLSVQQQSAATAPT